jgi:hypothetical protein
MPLMGGSISQRPAGWGGATFSLTTFYGADSGIFQEGFNYVMDGGIDLTRLDIEGAAHFPIGTQGAYWSLGLRYVRATVDIAGFGHLVAPSAPLEPFSFAATYDHFAAEIGVGASTALNSSGSQRFFGGITFLAGARHTSVDGFCCVEPPESISKTTGIVGVDTNIGYSTNLGPAVFYAGYRLFVLTEINHFAAPTHLDLVHGPELNLTFKLN